VYHAPDGWRLLSWPVGADVDSVDTNGHRVNVFHPGGFVRRFEIMGDTLGDDVGNCTSDDVFLSAAFDPVQVRLTRTTPVADSLTLEPEIWTRLSDALRTLEVRLDNFSCSTETDGSLTACTRDSNGRFFEPNASRVRLNGITLSRFSIPEVGRTQPHWMYVEEVNSSSVSIRPEASLLRLRIAFEEEGFELTTRCIDNFICGFSPDPGRGQIEGMRLDVYLRPTVGHRLDGTRGVTYSFDRTSVSIENFFMARGLCNDNLFAFLCGDINNRQARHLQQIQAEANRAVAGQLENRLVRSGLERVLQNQVCSLVTAAGRDCSDLRGLAIESGRLVAKF
jgi:hypothetical protein